MFVFLRQVRGALVGWSLCDGGDMRYGSQLPKMKKRVEFLHDPAITLLGVEAVDLYISFQLYF